MSQSDEKSAVSTRTVDVVVAVLFFMLGALVMWDSVRLGSRWGSDGPEAGYFPFYIGLILCIAAVVNGVRALRGKDIKNTSFVSASSLKMVMSVLIPTTVFVALIDGIGPVPGLGIYVASVLFVIGFMRWLGKYSWLKSVLVSVGVALFFFLMFEVGFKVPLPKGPLEAALGLD
jgi:putative tricarboxylic transport membrane protein